MSGAKSSGKLDIAIDAGVATITIVNPARHNAMSRSMWTGLQQALADLEHGATARCLIIRGQGDSAFCVGVDLSELDETQSAAEASLELDGITKEVQGRLIALKIPSIAMISGHCLGAGLALALACDIRIGSARSNYGIPAAKLGAGYDLERTKRLVDVVGLSKAKLILFSATHVPAADALRFGLIDHLVEREELEFFTRQLASAIADNAPLTIAAAKYCTELATSVPTPAEQQVAAGLVRICMTSDDFAEGRRAFMEKCKPNFTGR